MVMLITIGIGILVLVLLVMIASDFSGIAAEKGYESEANKVFWYCVLMPIGGYLFVMALPNRKANYRSNQKNANSFPGKLPSLD